MVTVTPALPPHAPRIAAINVAAMANDPLLRIQFPSEAGREALRRYLAAETAADLRRADRRVLVASGTGSGEVILGFVKWKLQRPGRPGRPGDDGTADLDIEFPRDGDHQYWEQYLAIAAEKREAHMGSRPFIHVSMICLAPEHQGKGAGTALLSRLKQEAAAEGLPVYLEATPNARALYEKLGWEKVDAVQLMIPREAGGEPTEHYEETCMLWEPRVET